MTKASHHVFIVLIVVLTSWSCSLSNEEPFQNMLNLELEGHLIIPIDSVTKRTSKTAHFNSKENELCLYNDIVHKLYFFDINSGKTLRVVDLNLEGPEAIGRVDKFFFQSYDSIFLYNSASHKLNLLDTTGSLKTRYQLVDIEKGDPTPVLHPALMHFDGKEFFVTVRTTTNTTEEKNKALMKYNLETRLSEFVMDLPTSYYNGRWADKASERSLTFNPNTRQLSVSFPFDSKLNVLELATNRVSFFEGNSNLMHEPESSKDISDIQARIVYLMSNSWYSQLFYDSNNEIYLRTAEVGKNIEYGEPLNAKYLSKNNDKVYSVTIVLDKDFNKVAEIPNLSFREIIFSSDKFIYIPDRNHMDENEDIIAFAKYKVKTIKQ